MTVLATDSRLRIRDLIPAIVLLVLLIGGLATATLMPTGKDDQYVVMVAPWHSLTFVLNSIQVAEGAIVSINDSAGLITVYSEHKDFPSRLYREGVWLVFEPLQAEGCLSIEQRTTAV